MGQKKFKPDLYKIIRHYGYDAPTKGGRKRYQPFKCFLHEDHSPSAWVNYESGYWGCMACNVSEDAYEFVRREEAVGFVEAKRIVSQITGQDDSGLRASPSSGGGMASEDAWSLF